MKTITLNILAEDIRNSSFMDSTDCAITRAIKRLNNSNLEGCALSLFNNKFHDKVRYPDNLFQRVRAMYHSLPNYPYRSKELTPIEPQDFSFDLEVPDNW